MTSGSAPGSMKLEPTEDPTRTDAAAGPASVRLRAVTIRYRGATTAATETTIVDSLDLDLRAGAMHCLAGRSGSGKTSVLRVAAGLVAPTSGDVAWAGRSVSGLSDDEVTRIRRGFIGYLDQGGVLISGLTAIENVLLPAVPGRDARRLMPVAERLLARLGVADRTTERPENLSGGERQRVALARALLLSPEVIMVDEPTASLDRAAADGVIGLLSELARDGIAVLVASHDSRLIGAADSRTQLL
jgi:ABC-type lipoprotein export system ATPase subunit